MDIISSDAMRRLERDAIESGRVTGLELMERAGQGVVAAIFEEWPELRGSAPRGLEQDAKPRAVVLCGPGNNGGDGFVVARLLHGLGWHIDVFFYGNTERLPEDARTNHDRWCALGDVSTLNFPQATEAEMRAFCDAASSTRDLLDAPDLEELPPFVVVDALFGLGASRPILGLGDVMAHMDYLWLWRDLNNSRLVAVDVPSGIQSDTGLALWADPPTSAPFPVIMADLTVTFHAGKPAHVTSLGPQACGKVVVKDIGL